MKGEELLRPLERNMRCEIYACKQMAKFSIGHPAVKASQFHICEECLRTVVEQAKVLLGDEAIKTAQKPVQEPQPQPLVETLAEQETDNNIQSSADSLERGNGDSEPTEPQEEENTQEEPTELSEGIEEPQEVECESVQEVYTCKHCGMTFKKPEEQMKYTSHVRLCPKNPKNIEKAKGK
ncbi:MAG: hypothetical protein ACK5MV_00070 [Aminipila sp.]